MNTLYLSDVGVYYDPQKSFFWFIRETLAAMSLVNRNEECAQYNITMNERSTQVDNLNLFAPEVQLIQE